MWGGHDGSANGFSYGSKVMDEEVGGSGRVLLEEVDEPVGGGVVGVNLRLVLQLRFDLLGQLLPQLNTAGY